MLGSSAGWKPAALTDDSPMLIFHDYVDSSGELLEMFEWRSRRRVEHHHRWRAGKVVKRKRVIAGRVEGNGLERRNETWI